MSRRPNIFLGLGILFFSTHVFSQDLTALVPGYYIVVGAYAKSQEKMAQQYVDILLKEKEVNAKYGYNAGGRFYFVYIKYFTDLRESLREMKVTRASGTFKDAWVRVVSGDIPDGSSPPVSDSTLPQLPARAPETSPTDTTVRVSIDSAKTRKLW